MASSSSSAVVAGNSHEQELSESGDGRDDLSGVNYTMVSGGGEEQLARGSDAAQLAVGVGTSSSSSSSTTTTKKHYLRMTPQRLAYRKRRKTEAASDSGLTATAAAAASSSSSSFSSSSSSSGLQLMDLGPDVVCTIFGFLCTRQRFWCVRRVNRWFKSLTSLPQVWQHFEPAQLCVNSHDVRDLLLHNAFVLKGVQTVVCTHRLVSFMLEHCPRLRKLRVYKGSIAVPSSSLQRLSSIEIKFGRFVSPAKVDELPPLDGFEMQAQGADEVQTVFERSGAALKKMYVWGAGGFPDELVRSLCESCPELETFMGRVDRMTDEGVHELANRCQKLKHIQLERPGVVSAAALQSLAVLPQLERLSLIGCPPQLVAGRPEAFAELTHLTRLRIKASNGHISSAVTNALSQMPSLEVLELDVRELAPADAEEWGSGAGRWPRLHGVRLHTTLISHAHSVAPEQEEGFLRQLLTCTSAQLLSLQISCSPQATHGAIDALYGCVNLRKLSVSHLSALQVVFAIAAMPRLEHLTLPSPCERNASVDPWLRMSQLLSRRLRHLDLSGWACSETSFADLLSSPTMQLQKLVLGPRQSSAVPLPWLPNTPSPGWMVSYIHSRLDRGEGVPLRLKFTTLLTRADRAVAEKLREAYPFMSITAEAGKKLQRIATRYQV